MLVKTLAALTQASSIRLQLPCGWFNGELVTVTKRANAAARGLCFNSSIQVPWFFLGGVIFFSEGQCFIFHKMAEQFFTGHHPMSRLHVLSPASRSLQRMACRNFCEKKNNSEGSAKIGSLRSPRYLAKPETNCTKDVS